MDAERDSERARRSAANVKGWTKKKAPVILSDAEKSNGSKGKLDRFVFRQMSEGS